MKNVKQTCLGHGETCPAQQYVQMTIYTEKYGISTKPVFTLFWTSLCGGGHQLLLMLFLNEHRLLKYSFRFPTLMQLSHSSTLAC